MGACRRFQFLHNIDMPRWQFLFNRKALRSGYVNFYGFAAFYVFPVYSHGMIDSDLSPLQCHTGFEICFFKSYLSRFILNYTCICNNLALCFPIESKKLFATGKLVIIRRRYFLDSVRIGINRSIGPNFSYCQILKFRTAITAGCYVPFLLRISVCN